MQLSRNAESLIADLARQQGLSELQFNAEGLIPILFDGEMQVAVGYSPNNDALVLMGVVELTPDMERLDCWDIFQRNVELAEKRTRLALDPTTHALVMCCDIYVPGLDFRRFKSAMDEFVVDLGAAGLPASANARPGLPAKPEPPTAGDGVILWS